MMSSTVRKIGMSVKYRHFWVGMLVMKDYIRDFCLWEMIHEICVINSGVKSGVQQEIELSSASLSSGRRPLRAGGRNWSSS